MVGLRRFPVNWSFIFIHDGCFHCFCLSRPYFPDNSPPCPKLGPPPPPPPVAPPYWQGLYPGGNFSWNCWPFNGSPDSFSHFPVNLLRWYPVDIHSVSSSLVRRPTNGWIPVGETFSTVLLRQIILSGQLGIHPCLFPFLLMPFFIFFQVQCIMGSNFHPPFGDSSNTTEEGLCVRPLELECTTHALESRRLQLMSRRCCHYLCSCCHALILLLLTLLWLLLLSNRCCCDCCLCCVVVCVRVFVVVHAAFFIVLCLCFCSHCRLCCGYCCHYHVISWFVVVVLPSLSLSCHVGHGWSCAPCCFVVCFFLLSWSVSKVSGTELQKNP